MSICYEDYHNPDSCPAVHRGRYNCGLCNGNHPTGSKQCPEHKRITKLLIQRQQQKHNNTGTSLRYKDNHGNVWSVNTKNNKNNFLSQMEKFRQICTDATINRIIDELQSKVQLYVHPTDIENNDDGTNQMEVQSNNNILNESAPSANVIDNDIIIQDVEESAPSAIANDSDSDLDCSDIKTGTRYE